MVCFPMTPSFFGQILDLCSTIVPLRQWTLNGIMAIFEYVLFVLIFTWIDKQIPSTYISNKNTPKYIYLTGLWAPVTDMVISSKLPYRGIFSANSKDHQS